MLRAVIFDMDGTLFDTEAVYGMAWMEAGLSEEQYLQMIGRSREANDATLAAWGFDPEAVRAKRDRRITEWLTEHGLPVKPGAESALRWLQEEGIPAAVATSSPLSVAEQYMKVSGFRPYLSRILSGYALEHGKPAPDIFLLAARELGVDPADCMVVEDSYNGVRAARAAGMITVMVPDRIPPDEEMRTLADVVLSTLEELPDYVRSVRESAR